MHRRLDPWPREGEAQGLSPLGPLERSTLISGAVVDTANIAATFEIAKNDWT